jgi:hypothetical protein
MQQPKIITAVKTKTNITEHLLQQGFSTSSAYVSALLQQQEGQMQQQPKIPQAKYLYLSLQIGDNIVRIIIAI